MALLSSRSFIYFEISPALQILQRSCSVRRQKSVRGCPMSSTVGLETKIETKIFTLSDEEGRISGPFIIVGTYALPLLWICLVIFQNSRDQPWASYSENSHSLPFSEHSCRDWGQLCIQKVSNYTAPCDRHWSWGCAKLWQQRIQGWTMDGCLIFAGILFRRTYNICHSRKDSFKDNTFLSACSKNVERGTSAM